MTTLSDRYEPLPSGPNQVKRMYPKQNKIYFVIAAYLHGSQLFEPQPSVQPGGDPGHLPAPDQRQHHHLRPDVPEQRGPESAEGDAAPAPQQRGHPGQGARGGGGSRGRTQHGHAADTPTHWGRGGGRGAHHPVPAQQEERGDKRGVPGVSAGAGAVQQQSKTLKMMLLVIRYSICNYHSGGGEMVVGLLSGVLLLFTLKAESDNNALYR